MASPAPSWVILATAPRVSAADEALAGADLSLAVAAPPRVTRLTLSPRVSPADPDPQARLKSPHILTADPSGLLLAITPPPLSARPPTTARVFRDDDGVERTIHVGRVPEPDYFVLDVPSATAYRVPDPDVFNPASLGVIAAPGCGGGYMVVEFQSMVGRGKATLVCFSSETGEWFEVDVDNPLPSWMWAFHDVFSHDGKLWWVDPAAGLLACDPFADQPDMAFVPLPESDKDGDESDDDHGSCSYCSERALGSRRCVQVSDGKFRLVEMSCGARHGKGAPTLSMRTLADPETAEWTLEYKVPFAEIWAGDSYKAAGLPEKAPVVALVHPKNPDVLYFFVGDYLFGVDMRAKKVVECEAYGLAGPSSCVLALELPPSLIAAAGSTVEVSGNGVKEESCASPSDCN